MMMVYVFAVQTWYALVSAKVTFMIAPLGGAKVDCPMILKSSNGVHTNRALQFTYHTERRQAASALRYRSSRKLCSSVFYITRREMSLLTAWPVKIYLYPAVEEILFYLSTTMYINTTIYKYQK